MEFQKTRVRPARRGAIYLLLAAVVAAPLAFLPTLGVADEHKDHDRARNALLSGEVLSLRQVLDVVSREYPGETVEIEFEVDDGIYVYEIKMLQPFGSVIKMKVEVKTRTDIKVNGSNFVRIYYDRNA